MDTYTDMAPESGLEISRPPFRALILACCATVVACLFVWLVVWLAFVRPPAEFPVKSFFSVEKGTSLSALSSQLEAAGLVRSASFFTFSAYISGNQGQILSGEYFVKTPISSIELLKRIAKGEFGVEYKEVTFPEGSSVKQIGEIMKKTFPDFDAKHFVTIAAPFEGYLFPDTYRFVARTTPEQVMQLMQQTFDQKLSTLQSEITKFGKPLSDVVKMASIVEEEGRTTITRRTIAGILWKRLSLGMPLQVDASFLYINGKNTYTLTTADLAIESPYNSYLHKGLPPTPITNPGLDSISATISPISTPYLYFLTDKKGVMHYGRTFDEHLANKAQFLK
ncbi:MAG: endolytic transglycosylase MltG [Patescibacteria group bacterium]